MRTPIVAGVDVAIGRTILEARRAHILMVHPNAAAYDIAIVANGEPWHAYPTWLPARCFRSAIRCLWADYAMAFDEAYKHARRIGVAQTVWDEAAHGFRTAPVADMPRRWRELLESR